MLCAILIKWSPGFYMSLLDNLFPLGYKDIEAESKPTKSYPGATYPSIKWTTYDEPLARRSIESGQMTRKRRILNGGESQSVPVIGSFVWQT